MKALTLGIRLNDETVIFLANTLYGLICEDEGDAKKAIAYHEEALKIVKKVYGDMHPKVTIPLNNLGAAWQFLGHAKNALKYYD